MNKKKPMAVKINTKVLFNYPNTIGYIRILLIISSHFFYKNNFPTFALLYSLSVSLDYFDGVIARKFNQCTDFGEMLDILTDVSGTSYLCYLCILKNSEFSLYFFFMIIFNVIGHWALMSVAFKKKIKHKNLSCMFYLLDWYFRYELFFMNFLILATEGFLLLFLYFWTYDLQVFQFGALNFLFFFFAVGAIVKNIVHVQTLVNSFYLLSNFKDTSK